MFSRVRTSAGDPICLITPGEDMRIILSANLALMFRSWLTITVTMLLSAESFFSSFMTLT